MDNSLYFKLSKHIFYFIKIVCINLQRETEKSVFVFFVDIAGQPSRHGSGY